MSTGQCVEAPRVEVPKTLRIEMLKGGMGGKSGPLWGSSPIGV